jgi:hypothetical protein
VKALTICQPWAEFILRGLKPVENRTWPTSHRGLVLIHAGKSREWLTEQRLYGGGLMPDGSKIPAECELDFGALVGVAELASCVELAAIPAAARTPFHAGPWCWELRNVRRFAKPIACRGAQGLWHYPTPLVAAAIETATPAATPGKVPLYRGAM